MHVYLLLSISSLTQFCFLTRGVFHKIHYQLSLLYNKLEIKPCVIGSRIRDIQAENYNGSYLLIGKCLHYLLFLFISRTGTVGWTKRQSVRLLYGVWPLATSVEDKNNHAHVTTPIILYKFIEVNFSVGCMVWPWCCQFQDSTTMSLMNRIIDSWQLRQI